VCGLECGRMGRSRWEGSLRTSENRHRPLRNWPVPRTTECAIKALASGHAHSINLKTLIRLPLTGVLRHMQDISLSIQRDNSIKPLSQQYFYRCLLDWKFSMVQNCTEIIKICVCVCIFVYMCIFLEPIWRPY